MKSDVVLPGFFLHTLCIFIRCLVLSKPESPSCPWWRTSRFLAQWSLPWCCSEARRWPKRGLKCGEAEALHGIDPKKAKLLNRKKYDIQKRRNTGWHIRLFPNSLFRAYVAAIPALNREFGNNLMCHPVDSNSTSRIFFEKVASTWRQASTYTTYIV